MKKLFKKFASSLNIDKNTAIAMSIIAVSGALIGTVGGAVLIGSIAHMMG